MHDVALRTNDRVVDALRVATLRGGVDLHQVPALLKRAIRDGCWKDRIITQTGQRMHFDRFIDFVRTPPLEGMGCELDMLRRICAEDKMALDMLDQATKGRQGARTDLFDDIQEVHPEAPTGTSTAATLRRLRKDHQDLHARVLAGELSPHAAAVEAGFRRRTVSVPADPAGAARALRRHLSAAQLRELIVLLGEEG